MKISEIKTRKWKVLREEVFKQDKNNVDELVGPECGTTMRLLGPILKFPIEDPNDTKQIDMIFAYFRAAGANSAAVTRLRRENGSTIYKFDVKAHFDMSPHDKLEAITAS